MKTNKITIYDIAKEAGVSPSMVSRVYNGKPGVSAANRKVINDLIEQYHYVPDEYAKALKHENTGCIGIIASDVCNPFFARIIYECDSFAQKKGYAVFTYETHDSLQMEMQLLSMLSAQKMEAIILLGGVSDWIDIDSEYETCLRRIAKNTPIITIGHLKCEDVYNVITDEARAMRTLLEYLIGLGHRYVCFLGGEAKTYSYTEKADQFRATLCKYHINVRDDMVAACGYEKEKGYQTMLTVLGQREIPTAVIAVNETIAMGASRAIKEKGLCIPRDISLACFDNSFVSESMTPSLTSVGCNYDKFARRLMYTVLDAIGDQDRQTAKVSEVVESVFVARDSVWVMMEA